MMFAPAFAPFANAEAIVNSKLALAMLEAGWDVDIISRNLVGVSSYDYGSAWVEPWVKLRQHTFELANRNRSPLLRKLSAAVSAMRLGHAVEGCQWAAHAYDLAMERHNNKPYNMILSRAFPDYAHLPALKMTRRTKVPWIANWNDPWAFLYQKEGNTNLKNNLGMSHNRCVLEVAKFASKLTFPSELMRDRMCECLPAGSYEKSSVVPHVGLPIETMAEQSVSKEIFSVCYAGRLWPEQDPMMFLTALRDVIVKYDARDVMKFYFTGIDGTGIVKMSKKLGITANVEFIGKKSYAETMQFLAASTVLLIIDPPSTKGMLLTSKFVDYVQVGRPILALTEKNGTLDTILATYGGGITADSGSLSQVHNALECFFLLWKDNTLSQQYVSKHLSTCFSQKNIINKLQNLFEFP